MLTSFQTGKWKGFSLFGLSENSDKDWYVRGLTGVSRD